MAKKAKQSLIPTGPAVESRQPEAKKEELIDLAMIDDDGGNHRLEGPRAKEAMLDMAESLRRNGQQDPVLLYAKSDGRFLVGFGHRRCAAARIIAWPTIRAVVEPMPSDPATIVLARTVENLHRLNLHPMEEAIAVKELCETYPGGGIDEEHPPTRLEAMVAWAAGQLHREESYIRDRLFLGRLCPAVAKKFLAGEILEKHARELAKLADPERQENIAGWLHMGADGHCSHSLEQVRRWVVNAQYSLHGVPWHLDQPFANKPACAACPNNSDNNPNLFEHDQTAAPAHTCLFPGCYDAKQKLATKELDKAVQKTLNKKLPITETGVAAVTPEFLKAASVARKAKKASEPEASASPAEKASEAPPAATPEEKAKQKFKRAIEEWEEKAGEIFSKFVRSDPVLLAAMILLDRTDWGTEAADARGDAAVAKLLAHGNAIRASVYRRDFEGLKFLAEVVMKDDSELEIPVLDYCAPAVMETMAEGLKCQLPAKPKIEDFMPKAKPAAKVSAEGAEDPDRMLLGLPRSDKNNPPDSEGYEVGQPWYYKTGGRILALPEVIVHADTGTWPNLEGKLKDARSRCHNRSGAMKFLATLEQEFQRACEDYSNKLDGPLNRKLMEDCESVALLYNHVISYRHSLVAHRQAMEEKGWKTEVKALAFGPKPTAPAASKSLPATAKEDDGDLPGDWRKITLAQLGIPQEFRKPMLAKGLGTLIRIVVRSTTLQNSWLSGVLGVVEAYKIEDTIRRFLGKHAEIKAAISELAETRQEWKCRVCGCTQDDSQGCIDRTGKPCAWVEPDLCSACDVPAKQGVTIEEICRELHGPAAKAKKKAK